MAIGLTLYFITDVRTYDDVGVVMFFPMGDDGREQ